jgi:hypothetical protein
MRTTVRLCDKENQTVAAGGRLLTTRVRQVRGVRLGSPYAEMRGVGLLDGRGVPVRQVGGVWADREGLHAVRL